MKYLPCLCCCVVFLLFASTDLHAAPWGNLFKGLGKIIKPAKKVPPLKVPPKVPAKTPAKTGGKNIDFLDDFFRLVPQSCTACNGNGFSVCFSCHGAGTVPGALWGTNRCSSCSGSGKIHCTRCNGTGKGSKK